MTRKELPDSERTEEIGKAGAPATPRRSYAPPRILSAEQLEAAAATCDPPTGALGKSVPFPCTTAGS